MGLAKLLVVLLSVTGTDALAYTVNSDDTGLRGWNTASLRVNVALPNCPPSIDMRSVVLQAMQVWNSVPDSKVQLQLGSIESTTSPGNARAGDATDSPIITCDADFAKTTGMDVNTVPGVGGVASNTSSKRIVYGYVILNTQSDAGANIASLSDNKLVIVVAHELGHLLGLGHSSFPAALMYPNITALTRASLSTDDLEGLRHLYPPNGFGDDDELGGGCASIESHESPPPPGSSTPSLRLISFLAYAISGAIGLGLLRRRRQRQAR